MNEKEIDKQGLKAIKPELDAIHNIKSGADLSHVITTLHQEAIFIPFNFGSSTDPHDPTMVMADTAAGGLGLPDRDYYFKDDDKAKETRQKYLDHVAATFQLAGYDKSKAEAAAQTVMRMETALAGASLTNVELRDPHATDHKMKIDDVQKLTPHFEWRPYFQAMNLDAAVDFNAQEPKFLQELERQLTQTPLADWKKYLEWHVLRAGPPRLSTPLRQQGFSFLPPYFRGRQKLKTTRKSCVEITDANLGEALGKKYVEKVFPPEAKARIQELVKNILVALHDDIGTLTWMSDETKPKALDKLAKFTPKVGYPDKWKDYSSVRIDRRTHWSNVREAQKFAVRDDTQRIGKPVDRGRWGMTTPTSNAYYNPLLNEIVFPAGILLPPMFDVTASDAVN